MQDSIREAGRQPKLPKISHSLEELAKNNDINLLIDKDRQKLTAMLKDHYLHAPIVHISFSSDPQPAFLSKIINWFRAEVDPRIILQVGLQPSIAAGCIVRTANKQFDFSLRRHFSEHRQLLLDSLSQGGDSGD